MRIFKSLFHSRDKPQDSFGLKIGIEGEKEFKNALRDINLYNHSTSQLR